MKKLFFLIIPLLFLINTNTYAQKDSLRVKALSDSIASLYERYFSLSEKTNRTSQALAETSKKVDASLDKIEDQYKVMENQAQGLEEQLSRITDADRRTVKTIYEENELSVVATANFMDAVNTSLNALEFSVSSLDYANSIFALNNPTNNELGFSLDKVIMTSVENNILRGAKFKKKFGDKLKGILKGIINNPIVNNPITKAVVSTVPAVSSITSAFNVVNSVAVSEESISASLLKKFTDEMQSYVAHYEALAGASRELDLNLKSLKVKTVSVRKLAKNFVKQNISDLYADKTPKVDNLDMNSMVKRYYNYANVSRYIDQLERANNMNYHFLSRRIVFPTIARTKASFIAEEVEKLYNEYEATLSNYHSNILTILNNATKLTKEPQKVTQKILALDKQYKDLLANYKKSVDLENLSALEQNIPRK